MTVPAIMHLNCHLESHDHVYAGVGLSIARYCDISPGLSRLCDTSHSIPEYFVSGFSSIGFNIELIIL
jgi:hypothetical protein